jgi:phospholipase/carboxylesterase
MLGDLLEAIEIETSAAPTASVIWMHGLGADGHDFVDVVPELHLPPRPGIRFVFPHAPKRPVTINGGYVMRAWYDIRDDHGQRREDADGVRASQKSIEALIQREKARGVVASSIVLAGFSQGGAMALHTGLRHAERLAGVMALSCSLPLPDALAAEAAPANRDVPIFMAHGTHDPMIPMARAVRAREALTDLGYRVEWHEYPMPHSVCAEEIADLAAWVQQSLAAARPSTR